MSGYKECHLQKLSIVEIRMLHCMSSTQRHKTRNEDILAKLNAPPIGKKMQEYCL